MKHRFIALFSLALSLAASLKAGAQVFALQYDADDGNKSVVQEYDNNGVLINPSLFTVTGATAFATSGNDLFIGSITSDNHGLISEYDSSGAVVNASLLTLSSFPQGLVISGNDLFVSTTTGTQSGAIGHYTVSGATLNSSFLGVTSTSMAISGNDLFVVDNANNRISEYTTSGQLVNASLISGLYYPTGMTISGNDLFVSNSNGTVGKYTLAGGTVNAALIQGLHSPTTLAVSGDDLFVTTAAGGNGTIVVDSTLSEYTTEGQLLHQNLAVRVDAVAAAPEPSTWALLLGGVLFLASFGRRRLTSK